MIEKIKNYMYPKVDPDVQKHIDSEVLDNIYRISAAVGFFEIIALILYLATVKQYDRETWTTIGLVSFCIITCLTGFFISGRMKKNENTPHNAVMGLKITYFIVMLLWTMQVSYRVYLRGEQLLTFFAVELVFVCFIPVKPLYSMLLISGVYIGLYAELYSIDGAKGINILNYIVLGIVSVIAMVVRFHSQVKMSERSVQLKRSNELLEFSSRHDPLTGLRNRTALNEDVSRVTGNRITAYMIDINDFKGINDIYGHAAGDIILRETGKHLEALFPGSLCYRYGGDEFLVLDTNDNDYEGKTFAFSSPSVPDKDVLLCIGRAQGAPADHDQLFQLIRDADADMYEVKRKTHSPEFGGHDRRRKESK